MTSDPTREELLLSEHFLKGIADEWGTMIRSSLDLADIMLGTVGAAPYLFTQTPRSYLRVYSARLAALTRMVDGELLRRENEGDYQPARDVDLDEALELHSTSTRAAALLRALTWLEGNNPDEQTDEPERPSQAA